MNIVRESTNKDTSAKPQLQNRPIQDTNLEGLLLRLTVVQLEREAMLSAVVKLTTMHVIC